MDRAMRTLAIVALAAMAGEAAAQSSLPPELQPNPQAAALAQPAPRWPRAIVLEQGTLTVYQPQLEKLEGVTLTGRCATSWQPKAGGETVFGVFWFDARVLVDKDARTMQVEKLIVTKVRYPNVTPEKEKRVAGVIEAEVPKWDITGSLDEVQASVAVTQQELKSEKGLSAAPPKIFWATDPAVLLVYDGEPIVRPLEQTGLVRAVNTPMFVVGDPSAKKVFLAGGGFWYEAPDAKGPWTPNATPTPAVKAVYDKNPPPPPPAPPAPQEGEVAPPPPAPKAPPRIIVVTSPTELIVFDGKPSYVPVGSGGNLLYADNTNTKVLVHVPTSETFVLLSGRWYKAASLDGPWAHVRPDKLPAAFKSIPPDSPVGDVRTFVTGTDEATDAVADAQIPQTTAVKRDQAIEVTYDGEPKFKKIEGTKLGYAVNTQFSVIVDEAAPGKYWCCHQAVWYVAQAPKGPWAVSDKRPPSIDQVPASAPVYNTKYVYVYQSTPEVVYVGYLPGYVGSYPYYGTVVYGTGYYYPPYVSPTVVYAYPATWGVHMTYSPYGGWGVGISYGTPFFSVGIHFGGYGGYYGPPGYRPYPPPYYGYRPPPPGYRPPPGRYPGYGGGYPGSRPGGPGGAGGVGGVGGVGGPGGVGGVGGVGGPGGAGGPGGPGRPGGPGGPGGASQLPAGGQRPGGGPTAGTLPSTNIYNRPENAGRNQQPSVSNRQQPSVGQQPNNVYGDRNGNVYRQNPGGGWDKNTGSGWQSAGAQPRQQPAGGGGNRASPQPTSYGGGGGGGGAPAGLNRDAAARNYGGGRGGGGGYGGGRGGGGGRRR